jgi:hypothetical protein
MTGGTYGGVDIEFNGDVRYAIINPSAVEDGEEFGVIFFDKQGNEIKRFTDVRSDSDKQYVNCTQQMFYFQGDNGVVPLSWEIKNVQTGELAEMDKDNENLRWQYKMFYITGTSVEEGTPIWGGFR